MGIHVELPGENVELPIEGRLEIFRREDGDVGVCQRTERLSAWDRLSEFPEEEDIRQAEQAALEEEARIKAFPIPESPCSRADLDPEWYERVVLNYDDHVAVILARRARAQWMRDHAPRDQVLLRLAQQRGMDDAPPPPHEREYPVPAPTAAAIEPPREEDRAVDAPSPGTVAPEDVVERDGQR